MHKTMRRARFGLTKHVLTSCIKLVGQSKPNPSYLDGYAQWKQAFDQGHAGVFTIPVSEIVGFVEATINK